MPLSADHEPGVPVADRSVVLGVFVHPARDVKV